MATIVDHDSYIGTAPEKFRPLLNHLRTLLREALPDADEIIGYKMPGYRLDGKVVASYAAFSKQVGLYVAAPATADHADEIAAAGVSASKTGVSPFSRASPARMILTGFRHGATFDGHQGSKPGLAAPVR